MYRKTKQQFVTHLTAKREHMLLSTDAFQYSICIPAWRKHEMYSSVDEHLWLFVFLEFEFGIFFPLSRTVPCWPKSAREQMRLTMIAVWQVGLGGMEFCLMTFLHQSFLFYPSLKDLGKTHPTNELKTTNSETLTGVTFQPSAAASMQVCTWNKCGVSWRTVNTRVKGRIPINHFDD